jgi:hypothetical protein
VEYLLMININQVIGWNLAGGATSRRGPRLIMFGNHATIIERENGELS